MGEASETKRPERLDPDTKSSISWIAAGFGVALVVAWFAGAALVGRGLEHPMLIVLGAEVAATAVLFVGSRLTRNAGFNDPHWSLSPPIIAIYLLASSPAESDASLLRRGVVLALVVIWSLRLTFNWKRSFRGLAHEDWRYAKLRREWGDRFWLIELGGIHCFSMLQTWLGCLALYPALVVGSRPFGWLDALAIAVTALAIWIEATADRQLHDFASSERLPGSILRTGLWATSRHPNYFGEILFWWGLYLFGIAANPGYAWTVIGPLAITGLFVFVTLPLMDERSLERRPGYEQQIRRVSALIPWFERS
jgi:steroid 5-alpha reductase family enzyme